MSYNEGQVTFEIYPQNFRFIDEPILKAINIKNILDAKEAETVIHAAFLECGFKKEDYTIGIRDVVNSFLGSIIVITILPWIEQINKEKKFR